MQPKISFGITGKIKLSVMENGKTVRELPWQNNLLLDQGLQNIGSQFFANLFKWGHKGTGTTPTSDIPNASGTANTYTWTSGQNFITRNTSPSTPRNFTNADIGRIIKFDGAAGKPEALIQSISSTTVANVDRNATSTLTSLPVVFYYVNQTDLTTELGVLDNTLLYQSKALAATTITLVSGSLPGGAAVNNWIYFPSANIAFRITNIAGTTLTLDLSTGDAAIASNSLGIIYRSKDFGINTPSTSQTPKGAANVYSQVPGDNSYTDAVVSTVATRTYLRAIIFDAEVVAPVAIDSAITRSGTTLTIAGGGAFSFTSAMVGGVVNYAGSEYSITAYTNSTTVTISPNSGPTSATNGTFYGFNTYSEVGFSHSAFPGNLNVRVALASPVNVLGPTGLNPSQQLKVQYQLTVTISPSTVQSVTPPSIDSGNQMSNSKAGTEVVENIGLSQIDANGQTDLIFDILEPAATDAQIAYSPVSTACVALAVPSNAPNRNTGIVLGNTLIVNSGSVTNNQETFSLNKLAILQLSEAIGTAWRSLMIYSGSQQLAGFTHLFGSSQTKDGAHTLTITYTLSWSRTLP